MSTPKANAQDSMLIRLPALQTHLCIEMNLTTHHVERWALQSEPPTFLETASSPYWPRDKGAIERWFWLLRKFISAHRDAIRSESDLRIVISGYVRGHNAAAAGLPCPV